MEQQIFIIIIEDEFEVLEALVNDLEEIEHFFPIETANSSEEAVKIISQLSKKGYKVGLILCDHILPGKNGVDLLIELHNQPGTMNSKKVLVTGQASHEDTIDAINQAALDYYIAKPWSKELLNEVVIQELTDFVIENENDLLPFMQVLDLEKISEAIRRKQITDH